MKSEEYLNRLFAAARTAPPDTAAVEYGFETRLLARLRSERESNLSWAVWSWRLMPALATLVIAVGVWSWFTPLGNEADVAQLAPTSVTEQTLADHWTERLRP
jgi:hypothetical protein